MYTRKDKAEMIVDHALNNVCDALNNGPSLDHAKASKELMEVACHAIKMLEHTDFMSEEMHTHENNHYHSESKFKRVFEDAEGVMKNMPPEWIETVDVPGGKWAIVEHTFTKAKEAYVGMKSNTITDEDFTKRLLEVVTAAAMAYEAMTCKE